MVTKVDFASPIIDNRQEVIAVKFGGALKNVCEMMFYSAMANDPQKWIKKYPGLDHLRKCNTIVERFCRLTYLTEETFLQKMRSPLSPLPIDEIHMDNAILRGELMNPMLSSITTLEIGLHNILRHSFCKKLIIFDGAFNTLTKNYFCEEYTSHLNKMCTMEGSLIDVIETDPSITTIFIDDVEVAMQAIEYYEAEKPELLKEKAFFIASNCSLDLSKMDGNSAESKRVHKYQDFLDTLPQRFGAQVSWFNLGMVNTSNPGEIVDTNKEQDPSIKIHKA